MVCPRAAALAAALLASQAGLAAAQSFSQTLAGGSNSASSPASSGFVDSTGPSAQMSFNWANSRTSNTRPSYATIQPNGGPVAGLYYFVDPGSSSVRTISPAGAVSTVIGNGVAGYTDGSGTLSQFSLSYGGGVFAWTLNGFVVVWVADAGNNVIRNYVVGGANPRTVYGTGAAGYADGVGTSASIAQFSNPCGITSRNGIALFVADSGNKAVRIVYLSATIPAGPNTAATFAGIPSCSSCNLVRRAAEDGRS